MPRNIAGVFRDGRLAIPATAAIKRGHNAWHRHLVVLPGAASIRALLSLSNDGFASVIDKDKSGRVVETAVEARQGELGPSVLMLLGVSVGLAVLILAITWMIFFRT